MKTKGKRPEGIVFTNANPRYAGKLDDPQGGHGDATGEGGAATVLSATTAT